jgi:hypothetical protein
LAELAPAAAAAAAAAGAAGLEATLEDQLWTLKQRCKMHNNRQLLFLHHACLSCFSASVQDTSEHACWSGPM